MKHTRFFSAAAILCLIFGEANGAYNPEAITDTEQKAGIKKITKALKALSKQERQAFIACKLGLLFLPSGEAAYSQEKKLFKTQNCRLYEIYGDVQFISTDGKMIAFHDCLQQKDKDEKRRNAWIQADQAVYALGDTPAFMELKKEVTDMVLALACRHYMKMPPEARQAIIAVLKGEVIGATAQMVKERVAGTDENITVPVYPSGAKFTGKDGQEYTIASVMEELKEKRLDRAWKQLLWCCALVGKKDILSMMAEQEKARKK